MCIRDRWETAAERYVAGQRVAGDVTRLMDFGAFVELEPGLEGLIHVSEMAWDRKVSHPSDVLRQGDRVDAIVLSVKPPTASDAGRISLGLKQTLADPWLEVERKFPVGSQIEGPVTKIMNFCLLYTSGPQSGSARPAGLLRCDGRPRREWVPARGNRSRARHRANRRTPREADW